ncbi:MAG: NosD domain-containing protein [Candidatus Thorarchaeota archaeon]
MPNRVSRCVLSLTLFMFLLALAPATDLEGITTQSTAVVSEPEKQRMLVAYAPHGRIAIDGDANFSDTALLEGWPGDGSPENPFIIDGLDINVGYAGGYCISINNTLVSFTISNCNLSSMPGGIILSAGIHLENVTNGELVNNNISTGFDGISLLSSDSNTVSDNTCYNNWIDIILVSSHFNIVENNIGEIILESSHSNTVENNISYISLESSHSNIVDNNIGDISLESSNSNTIISNICTNNENGIFFTGSHNTVANNTCTNGEFGISFSGSHNNVTNNNCSNNTEYGIYLSNAESNTVSYNTCNNNSHGIYTTDSDSNTVMNNNCSNNTEFGIYLNNAESNTVSYNTCNNNNYGIFLYDSHLNTVANNICNYNGIGIYLDLSETNTVAHNTCLRNTEHDIYLSDSEFNTVENNITTLTYSVILLLGGVLFLLPLGIVVVGFRKRMVSPKGDKDDIAVPARYRLVSWFRQRRSLKHEDVDDYFEPDSSD